MRILIKIEYNGTGFGGWQKQKNAVSVQEILENALEDLFKQKITLVASGRTDAGVHALGQCAHFDINGKFDTKRLPQALNVRLPETIRVLLAKEVPNSFNARFDVIDKTYIYKLYSSKVSSPVKENLYAHVPYELDLNKMQSACKLFLGKHNFKGFCSQGSSVKTFEREIYSLKLEKYNNEFIFKINGNGFLYNMVRRIVAAIVEVGKGKLKESDIILALKDHENKHITKVMQPCGLYLNSVNYGEISSNFWTI